MQKTILVFIAFLIACSSIPSESSVQTTIVQTQNSQPTITLEPTSTATPEPCAVLAREFYESISDLGLEWNENLSIVIGIGEVTEDDKTEAVAKMLSIYEEVKALTPPKCAQKMQEYLVLSMESLFDIRVNEQERLANWKMYSDLYLEEARILEREIWLLENGKPSDNN